MFRRGSLSLHATTVAVLGSLFLNGCAAVLGGGSSQGVHISAEPSNATYAIKSSSGLSMGSGSVPNQIRLPRKNEYQIDITADGFKTQTIVLTKSVNGWIWGNLVIGWLVGFIVDFATGAAYKLEPAVVSVRLQTVSVEDGGSTVFAVVSLCDENGKVLQEHQVEMEPVDAVGDSVAFAH